METPKIWVITPNTAAKADGCFALFGICSFPYCVPDLAFLLCIIMIQVIRQLWDVESLVLQVKTLNDARRSGNDSA